MNLKYDDFGKLESLDVYIVSQDRKSKLPIQVHNLKLQNYATEISKVTFDVYEDDNIIRDLYPWGEYKGSTWEEFVGMTWLDISRSENHSLLESLRIIYIPDLGDKAYFQLSAPIEIQENKKIYKSCTAYSLEQQLTQKDVSYFIINMGTTGSNDGVVLYDKNNPDKSLLDLALRNAPTWSVGEVDPSITFKSRSFEIDKLDIYSFLVDEVADAYKCIFTFDTVNCKVNATAVENYGKDTDIHISPRNLAKRINIDSTKDSIYTRFFVEGKDGLNIRDVNLGSDYIEDYSYYNTPEWFGSQELCDKYSNYVELRERQRLLYIDKQKENLALLNQYYDLVNRLPDSSDSTDWTQYGLNELYSVRDSYQNIVDTQIESGQNNPSHVNYQAYLINEQALADIKSEVIVREGELDTIQSSIDDVSAELKAIVDAADKEKYFTKDELAIFSSLEVNTDYVDESFVVTDSMPDEMVTQIKEELYEKTVEEIARLSRPQYSFQTEISNLFSIPEFREVQDGFDVGSFITLSIRDNYHVRLRLIAINIDFSRPDVLSVEFSDMVRSRDKLDDYMAMVDGAISGATTSIARNLNTSLIGVQEGLNTVESIARSGVTYEYLFANYASVGTLEAVNARIYNIEATYLTAEQAAIEFLKASEADILYAKIGDLDVTNANIDTLFANVGSIETLLNGNLTSDNIQSLNLTAQNTVIENGLIKNAMIDTVSANKINSGSINTNNVSIQSGSGNFVIQDNTIQISDQSQVRVQIGKDASDDYNMYVWDRQGNLMFDATGITENGIQSPIIRDDMVSSTANIDASKINISSLFEVLNDDNTYTLKGSKIYLDSQEQVLDIAFSEMASDIDGMASDIDGMSDSVSTLQTNLNIANGNISTIISQADLNNLENGNTTFYSQYVSTRQTVDSWELALANQNSTFSELLTEVSTNSAKISATPETIKAVVTSSYVNSLDSISSMQASIQLNATGIEGKVDKDGVIAAINLDPGSAKIQASKINLVGAVTVLSDLSEELGTITAGTINGVTINSTNINGGTITGTEINNGDGSFRVDKYGNLYTSQIETSEALEIYIPMMWAGPRMAFRFYAMTPDPAIPGTAYVDTDTSGISFNTPIMADGLGSPRGYGARIIGGLEVFSGDLTVYGTKNRVVATNNYNKVLLNAYETPNPTFADTGHGRIADDGFCYIDIDPVFLETIDQTHEYTHFLTKYGQGDLWIRKDLSTKEYFVAEGTPNLEFSWKIEAIQKGYNNYRLEESSNRFEGYEPIDYERSAAIYLESYEEELIT